MGRQCRFCNCRLWRLQQPFDERLRFDEGSRRRRRRHGRLRTDEACEELRVLSIDSPTLHGGLERLNCGRFCALTFELSGRRRQDARPGLAKMYRVPPDRAWWPAVGAPLERGVRHHRARCVGLRASQCWTRSATNPFSASRREPQTKARGQRRTCEMRVVSVGQSPGYQPVSGHLRDRCA